jgi:hypothetical protein
LHQSETKLNNVPFWPTPFGLGLDANCPRSYLRLLITSITEMSWRKRGKLVFPSVHGTILTRANVKKAIAAPVAPALALLSIIQLRV